MINLILQCLSNIFLRKIEWPWQSYIALIFVIKFDWNISQKKPARCKSKFRETTPTKKDNLPTTLTTTINNPPCTTTPPKKTLAKSCPPTPTPPSSPKTPSSPTSTPHNPSRYQPPIPILSNSCSTKKSSHHLNYMNSPISIEEIKNYSSMNSS